MKKLNLFGIATLLILLLLSIGCKKDDETQPENQDPKEFTVETVNVPEAMSQSNDPGAQQTASYMNMMNSMAGYGSMMIPPDKSSPLNLKDGETEIITWEFNEGDNNYSVTLKITETSTYIKWEMIISGMLDGHQLNNFTYLMAKENKDGSGNFFTVYDFENQDDILMTMNWYESGGTTYFTFEVPEDILITMEVAADGSGELEAKEWRNGAYVLDFTAVWDASGHGEAWDYDNGEIIDHTEW